MYSEGCSGGDETPHLTSHQIFHEYLIIFYCICGNFFFVYVLIRFPPKTCTLFNLYIYLGIQVGEKQ